MVDGFRLDRGFQVLLTAYPEAQAVLDYGALQLHAFAPGALVRYHGQLLSPGGSVAGPRPRSGLRLLSPVAHMGRPVAHVPRCGGSCSGKTEEEIFTAPETPWRRLRGARFSRRFIEYFLRPWIGGAMLDTSLGGCSRMFEFLFRMFALGDAAVPAEGMGAIPRQLAAALPRKAASGLRARVEARGGRERCGWRAASGSAPASSWWPPTGALRPAC